MYMNFAVTPREVDIDFPEVSSQTTPIRMVISWIRFRGCCDLTDPESGVSVYDYSKVTVDSRHVGQSDGD